MKGQWGIDTGWHVRLDFPGHGYINLWRDSSAKRRGAAAVLFLDCISRTLEQKLNHLEAILYE